jgi:hypothetical protein
LARSDDGEEEDGDIESCMSEGNDDDSEEEVDEVVFRSGHQVPHSRATVRGPREGGTISSDSEGAAEATSPDLHMGGGGRLPTRERRTSLVCVSTQSGSPLGSFGRTRCLTRDDDVIDDGRRAECSNEEEFSGDVSDRSSIISSPAPLRQRLLNKKEQRDICTGGGKERIRKSEHKKTNNKEILDDMAERAGVTSQGGRGKEGWRGVTRAVLDESSPENTPNRMKGNTIAGS